ncbi:MAG: hypothetical protein ACKOC5_04095 [Chloroflexota bacterium]
MYARRLTLLLVLLLCAGCNLPSATPDPGQLATLVAATLDAAPTAAPTAGAPAQPPVTAPPVTAPLVTAPPATAPPFIPTATRPVIQPLPSQPPPTWAPPTLPPAPPTATRPPVGPPPTQPVQLSGPYAVVLVEQGDVLNVRRAPGAGQAVVARLAADTTGIRLTGQSQPVDEATWLQIALPDGRGYGWVNGRYLTEQVRGRDFCRDAQVEKLLTQARRAFKDADRRLLQGLVSPRHGLDVTYLRTGKTVNYTPEEAGWALQSDFETDWGTHPASGEPVKGTFKELVLPALLDVLAASPQAACNEVRLGGSSYTYRWPERYQNINFYALHRPGPAGQELDWRTWLVGVEYVNGRPYLFALNQLFWEP